MHLVNKYCDFFLILLVIVIFIPSTISIIGLSQIKVTCLIISVLFFYILFYRKKSILKELDGFSILNIIFCIINLIPVFIKFLYDGSFEINEIFDSIRYLFFAMLYLIIKILYKKDDFSNKILKYLIIGFIISAIIGITQFFNFLNLNELYIPKIAPTQFRTLMPDYENRRIIGLNTNPTVFGFNMIIAIFINLIYGKTLKSNKIYLLIISIIEIVALLMTNSRTAQIALIISFLIYFILHSLSTYGKKFTFKVTITLIILGLLILVFIIPKDLTWRLLQIIDINNVSSWSARLTKWNDYFQIIQNNLLIGIGPIKNMNLGYIDSEWIQICLQIGLIGLLTYLAMIIIPLKDITNKAIKYLYLSLLIVIMLYNITSTSLLNYENSFKLYILIGIICSINVNRKTNFYISYGSGVCIDKSKCRKKLLIVATYFPPVGGVGVFRITKFVKFMSKYGVEPVIITVNTSNFSNLDYDLLKNIPSNVKIYRLTIGKNKDASIPFYFSLKRNLKAILEIESPDQMLITGGPFFILPIGRFALMNFSIPYTIDLRDPWSLQRRERITISLKGLKYKLAYFVEDFLEYLSLISAKNIITVNETMTEEYQLKYKKIRNKFYTVNNGIDMDDFKEIKPKYFKNNNVILYTGKFNVSAGFRDPSILLKAIAEVNKEGYDYHFVHIGQIDERVISIASTIGIEDKCEFMGIKPYGETLQYCKGAKILVVIGGTEKSEQTGKIFDYMGCQKPVLALCRQDGEIAKICKIVTNYQTAELHDLEAIKNALRKVYKCEHNDNYSVLNEIYDRNKITQILVFKLFDNIK